MGLSREEKRRREGEKRRKRSGEEEEKGVGEEGVGKRRRREGEKRDSWVSKLNGEIFTVKYLHSAVLDQTWYLGCRIFWPFGGFV